MTSLSVAVITLNEERNLDRCLASVRWVDEIVVVDSGSTDGTAAIAQRYGAHVTTRPFTNYGEQKNAALALATCDWVLSLDADEEVSPDLGAEIRQAISDPGDHVAYYLPRLDHTFGRWLHHGLSWPQDKVRLIRRGCGQWRGAVHELLIPDGPVGRLRQPILHHHYESISQFVQRTDRYTSMEAETWRAAGVQPSLWKIVLYPPGLFLYAYVWRLGALDGVQGFVLAMLLAYYTFLKRVKLWEMSNRQKPASPPSS
jgi:glycosyltransferase involved in cell wall biosynthesis